MVGIAVGSLSLAASRLEQGYTPKSSIDTLVTFTYPDGSKCVDGVYESTEGVDLAPNGGCAENSNNAPNRIVVFNGYDSRHSGNTVTHIPHVAVSNY